MQNRQLFQLSREKKEAFAHPPEPNPNRGWSYVGQENLSAISGYERGEENPRLVIDLKVRLCPTKAMLCCERRQADAEPKGKLRLRCAGERA